MCHWFRDIPHWTDPSYIVIVPVSQGEQLSSPVTFLYVPFRQRLHSLFSLNAPRLQTEIESLLIIMRLT